MGEAVGAVVGRPVGAGVGEAEGEKVGYAVGVFVGADVGEALGDVVGWTVPLVGLAVGAGVGDLVFPGVIAVLWVIDATFWLVTETLRFLSSSTKSDVKLVFASKASMLFNSVPELGTISTFTE